MKDQSSEKELFEHCPVPKAIFKLALPTVIGQIILVVYNMADTCMDELKKKKIAVLPIENLSMMREINIVYSQDFEHFETLRDIVRSYNETRGVVGDRK